MDLQNEIWPMKRIGHCQNLEDTKLNRRKVAGHTRITDLHEKPYSLKVVDRFTTSVCNLEKKDRGEIPQKVFKELRNSPHVV